MKIIQIKCDKCGTLKDEKSALTIHCPSATDFGKYKANPSAYARHFIDLCFPCIEDIIIEVRVKNLVKIL